VTSNIPSHSDVKLGSVKAEGEPTCLEYGELDGVQRGFEPSDCRENTPALDQLFRWFGVNLHVIPDLWSRSIE